MHRIVILWLLEFAVFLVAFWQWHLHLSQLLAHALALAVTSGSVLLACRIAKASCDRRMSLLKIAAGVAVGTYFLVVCAAHLVVLAALSAWGQLPTIDMVRAYAGEFQFMESAIGVPPILGAAILSATWIVVVVAHIKLITWQHTASENGGGSSAVQQSITVRTALLALALLVVAVPTSAALYFDNPDFAATSEPLYVAVNGDVWRPSQTNPTTDLRLQQLQKRDDDARQAYRPSLSPDRKNVVLITVDALRPDHMSLYGYSRKTTPVLDALAAQGRLNWSSQARSPCAESFCGLLSLLTGKHAHKLATKDFGLVDVLGLHGYKRHAILSGDHARFYGLRERYGPFDSYSDGGTTPGAGGINDDGSVLARVSTLPAASQPTFLFIHLMSAHGLGRKHPDYQRWLPAKSVYNLRIKRPDAALLAEVANGYDSGVLQADAMIGKILAMLENKGYMDRAVVFVTGDHGDFLGEHDEFSHSKTLLDPVLRVPWVWIGDSTSQLPLNQPVVHSDFAPTLLRILGISSPAHWDGRALQDDVALQQSFHQQAEFAGLIDYSGNGRTKYLFDRKRLKSYAYDLVADPAETRNIFEEKSPVQQRTWKRLLEREQLTVPYACGADLGC